MEDEVFKSAYAFTIYDYDNYPNTVFVILPHSALRDSSTKSHEISHAVDRVMARLQLKGEECRAYMVGYLMNEIDKAPKWEKP